MSAPQGPRPGDPHWRVHDDDEVELLLASPEAEELIAFLGRIPELKTLSPIKPAVMIPSPEDQGTFMEVYLTQTAHNRELILRSLETRETGAVILRPFDGSDDRRFFLYSSRFLGNLAAVAQMETAQVAAVIAQTHLISTPGDDLTRMAFGRLEPETLTREGREVYENWKALRVEI